MGRVSKGISCSVQGCGETAEKSLSENKGKMASDLSFNIINKRVYLCRNHYKEWKKETKEERENERARWN